MLIGFAQIEFDSGVSAVNGNELTPTQVKNQPIKVEWPVEDGAFYTLCFLGILCTSNLPIVTNDIMFKSRP